MSKGHINKIATLGPRPKSDDTEYEYCVMMYPHFDEPYRVPPETIDGKPVDALDWCQDWVESWEEDAPTARPGLFYVARRPVGKWEKI